MKERDRRTRDNKDDEEEEIRGIVSIPNIPNITRAYSRIAKQHKFRTTTRADNKIKDLASKAKTPLRDKYKNVVYNPFRTFLVDVVSVHVQKKQIANGKQDERNTWTKYDSHKKTSRTATSTELTNE